MLTIRPGVDGVSVPSWGTITVDVAGVDAIDFQSDAPAGEMAQRRVGIIRSTGNCGDRREVITVVSSG